MTGGPVDVVVIGLNEENLPLLKQVPDADRYRFHGLFSIDELQGDEIPIAELMDRATAELSRFDRIDAIVGFWDFPVSTMLPILCRRFGVRGPRLEPVLKCEHKYWSRLEQREVIDDYPAFGLVDLDEPRPPDGVDYPFWVKPVKSFSSRLAFEVTDDHELRAATARMREGIARVGKPFEYLLDHAELPTAVADSGGRSVLAEQALSGARAAVEGYSHNGEIEIYGVLDSLVYPGVSSFLRHQYPSQLPDEMQRRLADVSTKVIAAIGLEPATFSIEFFCDPETGEINLLEINPRHSQAHAELFAMVDGVPNHHYMLKVALGEDPTRPEGRGPYRIAARWYLRRFSDGLLRRGPTQAEIDALRRRVPGVNVYRRVADGTSLSQSGKDSYSYELAELVVGAHDVAELEQKYARCVDELPFEFTEES